MTRCVCPWPWPALGRRQPGLLPSPPRGLNAAAPGSQWTGFMSASGREPMTFGRRLRGRVERHLAEPRMGTGRIPDRNAFDTSQYARTPPSIRLGLRLTGGRSAFMAWECQGKAKNTYWRCPARNDAICHDLVGTLVEALSPAGPTYVTGRMAGGRHVDMHGGHRQ